MVRRFRPFHSSPGQKVCFMIRMARRSMRMAFRTPRRPWAQQRFAMLKPAAEGSGEGVGWGGIEAMDPPSLITAQGPTGAQVQKKHPTPPAT